MNIQAADPGLEPDPQRAYKEGHRDARHAAAELALKADARIEALIEALNVAGGALFRLSPYDIEDDEDERGRLEHVRAVGLAAVDHAINRKEQFPGVDIDAVHRKA